MRLYTIGYEGATLEEFIETLQRHRVKLVADLRKNPVSRKKGFSKRLLGEGLKAHEIEYLHLPGLGTPTEWRKQAKAGLITREKMFRDYEKKILPKRPEELELLRKRMHQRGLALLCYEADASDCHRSYVAEKLAQLEKEKVRIVNIHIPQKGEKKCLTFSKRLTRFGRKSKVPNILPSTRTAQQTSVSSAPALVVLPPPTVF